LLPEHESLKGKRDYAILALLLGCGLRRKELVSEVKDGAMAQRENRWVLIDITGKGNRVRSVAVPAWVKAAIRLDYRARHQAQVHPSSIAYSSICLASDVPQASPRRANSLIFWPWNVTFRTNGVLRSPPHLPSLAKKEGAWMLGRRREAEKC
jgi:integrase